MSIEKYEIDSFKKESIPFAYTTLPNVVLQNFTDALALGVWVHLMSLPEDWTVNKKYLMGKFNIGRDKLIKILNTLRDNHLIAYELVRSTDGTIKTITLIVKNGADYYNKVINNQQHDTSVLKNQTPDKPDAGKSAPTKEIDITNENNLNEDSIYIRQRKKKPKVDYPLNFRPKESHLVLAQDLNIDVTEEFIAFQEYHLKHGNQFACWDMAFNTWLRNARKFKSRQNKKTYAPGEALSIACGGNKNPGRVING